MNVCSNSRVHPNEEIESENVEVTPDSKDLIQTSTKTSRTNASATSDDSNLARSEGVEDQGRSPDEPDAKEFSDEAIDATAIIRGNKRASCILNRTGKYEPKKRNPETDRDRKVIFADRMEGHCDLWEENYYVQTHYSIEDRFGNDEEHTRGLGCRCAIV